MIIAIKASAPERASYLQFTSLIIAVLFAMLSLASMSFAEQQATVFYLDKNYNPMVNLKQIEPVSEGMKAILAMYALQVGGGCQGHDESGLRCKLTTSLGLGAQCSPQHLDIVSSWFKKSIPKMSGYPTHAIKSALKSGDLKSICYKMPEGATIQEIWEIIRVKQRDKMIFVDAISNWTVSADGPSGQIRYETVYRINAHSVTVVKHKKISVKKRKN
jgi:hypothetical protein